MASRVGEMARELATAFANRDLRRLQTAWSLAWIADWAYLVALGIFAFEHGGAVAVGVAGLVRMGPAAAVAPFVSLLGDRHPRLRLLLVNQIVWTLALVCSVGAFFAHAPALIVYVLAGVTGVSSTILRPTLAAILPWLSRTPDELVAANAALTTIESLGTLIGPLIGGIVVAVLQPGAVFGVTAAASGCAAIVLASARAEGEEMRLARASRPHVFREAFAGFGVLLRDRDVGLIVLLSAAQTIVRGALNVLTVVVALGILHLGESGPGILTAAVGAGGLVGSLLSMRLVGQRLARPIGISLILWGAPIAAIGAVPKPVAAIALLAVLGGGNALFDVATYTVLQRMVPDEYLSRVLGLLFGLAMAGVAIGSIATPLLIRAIGIRLAMVVVGAFLPALVLVAWRRLAAIDRRAPVRTTELRLLREIPIFASFSVAAAEYLARTAEVMEVPASTILIREGEAGDRFYVVADGRFDITRQGRGVTTEETGGFFGEIALIRDVPRQATVTAAQDSTVYAFERGDFIAAVTGHALSNEATHELIESRFSLNERVEREPTDPH